MEFKVYMVIEDTIARETMHFVGKVPPHLIAMGEPGGVDAWRSHLHGS